MKFFFEPNVESANFLKTANGILISNYNKSDLNSYIYGSNSGKFFLAVDNIIKNRKNNFVLIHKNYLRSLRKVSKFIYMPNPHAIKNFVLIRTNDLNLKKAYLVGNKNSNFNKKLSNIKYSLWKEGAFVSEFGFLGYIFLAMFFYILYFKQKCGNYLRLLKLA